MNDNLKHLSEDELIKVIENAEQALKIKKENKKKEIINQIKALASSIDIDVEFHEGRKTSRKGIKVLPKYRNPDDLSQQWTGRGVKPRWLQNQLSLGKKIEDFMIL